MKAMKEGAPGKRRKLNRGLHLGRIGSEVGPSHVERGEGWRWAASAAGSSKRWGSCPQVELVAAALSRRDSASLLQKEGLHPVLGLAAVVLVFAHTHEVEAPPQSVGTRIGVSSPAR